MSTAVAAVGPPPARPEPPGPTAPLELYRLTVKQYERMGDVGILSEDDKVELINGYLVRKMTKHEPHSAGCALTREAISGVIPAGWYLRTESPVRIPDFDEPEPDFAIVRGAPRHHYRLKRPPEPPEVALVIEVSDSSLQRDRTEKQRAYAHGGVPTYWIVNVVDNRIEVHTRPEGDRYAAVQPFEPGQEVAVIIDGREVGRLAVADLLP